MSIKENAVLFRQWNMLRFLYYRTKKNNFKDKNGGTPYVEK